MTSSYSLTTETQLSDFARAAVKITAEAASIPVSFFAKKIDIEQKQDQSPVTVADRQTELFLRAKLHDCFPDHSLFGEEFGVSNDATSANKRYQWIIDPIDGTRSFISAMPLYGMLLALLEHGRPILGLIRMPQLKEVYYGYGNEAFADNGAKCRIKCSNIDAIADACCYINGVDRITGYIPEFATKVAETARLTRFSYDCYPFALLAAGHIDAVIDCDLEAYDFMPLIKVVEAAGGIITDWHGRELGLRSQGRIVAAATTKLHHQIVAMINRA